MTKLETQFNFLLNRQAQFESLLALLGSLTEDIVELDFRYNHLDRLDVVQLKQILLAIPAHVRFLSFYGNHLGEKLAELAKFIPASIEKLDLSHNQLIRLDQIRYSQLLFDFPLHVQSLVLDYQDLSLTFPFFPDHLKELRVTRRTDLIQNFDLRKYLYHKLPADVNQVYLDDTLWAFAPGMSNLASLVKPMTDTLIIHMNHLEFSLLATYLQTLPENIKRLDLDFCELDYLEFHVLSRFYKMQVFLDFPPHIEEIVCNGNFRAKRLELGGFQFSENPSIEFQIAQQSLIQSSIFAPAEEGTEGKEDFYSFLAEFEEEEAESEVDSSLPFV